MFYVLLCVIFVLHFSVLLALRLPCLGQRKLILVLLYICSIFACLVLSVSSSSLCLGRAAVFNCGSPWTFLFLFSVVLVFVSPLSIAITSLGEEGSNPTAFCTFVRFALVWFYLFTLPLRV